MTYRAPTTLRELRDHAMLAVLIGCGLRRGELLALQMAWLQQREEHWVIADLVGKGGHVRTVPVPAWVKTAVDRWTIAADITDGAVFRAIHKAGRIWGDGMTAKVLWDAVRAAATAAGIDKLAPHDLGARARACATSPAVNWTRSSSSWGMSRSKRRNATWDANRTSDAPSTTGWASNPMSPDRTAGRADVDPPCATTRYLGSAAVTDTGGRAPVRRRVVLRS